MNRLMALVKREYWENKGAFRTTPMVLIGLYVVGAVMTLITFNHFDNEFHTLKEAIRFAAQQDVGMRGQAIYVANIASSAFFTLVMGFVVFFYLLGSLYDDRKDRSILFWKSLPASDTLTLASKLISAIVVVPVLFWAAYVITMVVLYIILSITVLMVGESPWELFLSIGNPFKAWGILLASYLAHSLWALPVYGWLVLVSSFAPRIPLLFALVPPAVFAVLQIWIDFLRTFTLKTNLGGLLWEWYANSPMINCCQDMDGKVAPVLGIPLTDEFDHAATIGNMLDRLFSMQMLWGLLIAGAFLATALWLRRRATES